LRGSMRPVQIRLNPVETGDLGGTRWHEGGTKSSAAYRFVVARDMNFVASCEKPSPDHACTEFDRFPSIGSFSAGGRVLS
jgi:hypothetical protein